MRSSLNDCSIDGRPLFPFANSSIKITTIYHCKLNLASEKVTQLKLRSSRRADLEFIHEQKEAVALEALARTDGDEVDLLASPAPAVGKQSRTTSDIGVADGAELHTTKGLGGRAAPVSADDTMDSTRV